MDRREFLQTAGAGMAGAFLMTPRFTDALAAGMPETDTFLLSANGCGRATGYAETNKIVTLGDKTHVTWLDSEGDAFVVRVRTLDRATGDWSPVYTVGNAYDNHGGPALTADSHGHLHIVYYPHHHPFRYRVSKRPNDASEWGEEIQFGERCTYPTLVVAPDDTLILTCRESNRDGRPWVVNRYVKEPGEPWSKPTAILVADEGGYSHFQEALAWGPDGATLHLSTRMYGGTPGRAHTVGYMRSLDRGDTWQNAEGAVLELPATSDTISAIDRAEGPKGAGFRCGAIAVDPHGSPVILYSNTSVKPSAAWLVSLLPGGVRTRQPLAPAVNALSPGANIAMPGGLSIGPDGRVHVVLTLSPPGKSVGWGNPADEIVYLTADRAGGEFKARQISRSDLAEPHWLPNIERPTGHHTIDNQPGIIYQGGTRGNKNTDILANNVYWVG
jgi:hypothetical protein